MAAKMFDTVKVDLNDIMTKRCHVKIKVVSVRKVRLRMWAGMMMLRLAAFTLPADVELEA